MQSQHLYSHLPTHIIYQALIIHPRGDTIHWGGLLLCFSQITKSMSALRTVGGIPGLRGTKAKLIIKRFNKVAYDTFGLKANLNLEEILCSELVASWLAELAGFLQSRK